jgi:hypothetical protein
MILGTLCWLEFGLSIPFHQVPNEQGQMITVSTPRNGGEKNYVGFFFASNETN